jgi:hypothetical protein
MRRALLVDCLMMTAILLMLADPVCAKVRRVRGQTVYVPAYSYIYHGDRKAIFDLTVTLSSRNTDRDHPIKILSLEYFDSHGKLLRKFLEKETTLPPLGSVDCVVKESEKAGGVGANFLVGWEAGVAVSEPIIESIMISTAAQQGISFSSRGEAIEEH